MRKVRKTINSKSKKICSVPQCSSYATKDISLFKFPKDAKLRSTWQKVLRIRKPISEYNLVCSQHFLSSDLHPVTEKTERRRLKRGVIPSQIIEKKSKQRNRRSIITSSSVCENTSPVVETNSSEPISLIYDAENKRRKNWFEFHENWGLKGDSVASFKVCANNVRNGKPSPTIDSKCKDCAPSLKLPFSEIVIGEEMIEIDKNKKKRRRSRSNKRYTKSRNSIKRKYNSLCSKSVEISESVQYRKSSGCFESVCHSKFLENEKAVDNLSETISHIYKSNILPPLNCASSTSTKQQNKQCQTLCIQPESVNKHELADEASSQACLGEIIEFIRMQVLDYNLKAFGDSFKITECALQFRKEDGSANQKFKDTTSVVVHPTMLFSSNQSLLESVTISLDLHRLQQKNKESTSTGFIRTMIGKTETIEKMSDILTEPSRHLKDVEKNNESLLNGIVLDDESINRSLLESQIGFTARDNVISPVSRNITSAIANDELLKDSIATQSRTKQNVTFKKLARSSITCPQSVPIATRSSSRISSAGRKRYGTKMSSIRKTIHTVRKIPCISNKKWLPMEKDTALQSILGTTKVPRVVLPKLPYNAFKHGKGVPLGTFSTDFEGAMIKRTITPNKDEDKLQPFCQLPQLLCLPGNSVLGTSSTETNFLAVDNTNLSLKTVKNRSPKLPQVARVAGYLLVPNTSTVGGTAPIMYVPKPDGENADLKANDKPQNISFEELLKKGVPMHVLSGRTVVQQADGASSTLPKTLSGDSSLLMPLQGSSPSAAPQGVQSAKSKTKMVVFPKLLRDDDPTKKLYSSSNRKNIFYEGVRKDKVELGTDPKVLPTSCRKLVVPLSQGAASTSNQKHGEAQNDRKVLLRGKKNYFPVGVMTKCKNRFGADNNLECNVCGKAFVEVTQLGIHLITHAKCDVSNENYSKKFAKSAELKVHEPNMQSLKVKNNNKYKCRKCKKRFTSRKTLKCHVQKKHPLMIKRFGFKMRCKFCRDIFELDYYKQVHSRECREKKKQTIEQEKKGGKNANFSKKHFKKLKTNHKANNTKANRKSIKVKDREKNMEDDLLRRFPFKVDKLQDTQNSKITPKKPTAIRSHIVRKHDFATQLCKISNDFEESSASEYEQEELLNEDFEDVITVNKIERERTEDIKSLMNIQNSDTDVDLELQSENILKVDDGKVEDNNSEVSNDVSNGESLISEGVMNRIDISELSKVDGGTNNIVFEEMDDDEYFSMDESTQ